MSTTPQHTPGPWRVEPRQWDQGASIAIVGGTPEEPYIVALIPPENDDEEPTMDTAQRGPCDLHNATLLASAPMLLGALKKARNAYMMLYAEALATNRDTELICKMASDERNNFDAIIADAEKEARLI